MIQLRTLGLLDLRDGTGNEIRSVLQQPKRLGLLAFLTLASPRRYHRRDSLLAMFWPELDDEHARAALRRSLYYLRTALGAEVIQGRGEEEVAVTADELWCDAASFEEALRAENPIKALELYGGDLLEGFHVSGAPAFQDWLDRERGRLRDAAAGAAWSLADQAERSGDAAAAGRWGRRGYELTPYDEDVLCRLLGVLDRTGDRSGALRVYDDFARRLSLEYDLDPAAETRALVDAIRTRPTHSEAISTAARVSPAAPVTLDPRALAVIPFDVRGASGLGYLSEGMVHLLSTALEGATEVRIVDPRAILSTLSDRESKQLSVEHAREIAAQLGAGLCLLGTVLEGGGRLRLTATLYGPSGAPRATMHSESAGEAQLFEVIDELAREVLDALSAGPGMRLARLAARMTASLPALKCYLEGERCLRRGRYFDAMELLQRATREDPAFALAHYHLAAAAAGCAMPGFAREVIERAYAHRDRLTEHDRLLLDAQRAWLLGEVSNAESLYNAITASYPDDVEAWFHLGDMLFHCNPLRGRSAVESRGAFERALGYEPDHIASLVHLMRIAAIERRRDQALELARKIRSLSPAGDQSLALDAFIAFATGDEAAMNGAIDALRQGRAVTVAVAFSDVALYSGNIEGAERIARAFIEVARSTELRALCHIGLAHLALSEGRWSSARVELAAAQKLDHSQGLEARALAAAVPFVPVEPGELKELRDELRKWDASRTPPSALPALAVHNCLHSALKEYLDGLLAVRAGQLGEAHSAMDRLGAQGDNGDGVARARLGKGLAATLARAEHGPEQAMGVLGPPAIELWFQTTVASPFLSLAHERFLRAELLQELGREAEALGWYGSIAERSPYELVYAAPAHLRRAEIFGRQGDSGAAKAEYEQARLRWAKAERQLQRVHLE
jgi:DNA-binding SARP family transcriptional activator